MPDKMPINIPKPPEEACLCRACIPREEPSYPPVVDEQGVYMGVHTNEWDGLNYSSVGMTERQFITKDSGKREQFSSGMVRDVQTDKPRYDLIGWGWKLIKRWAELVGRGAVKYGELNFEKACTEEEMRRFKSSALRHMIQWYEGETDEDHAAACCFNLAGAEAVKEKLK